jgi:superfamily II DNA or RNA helicase
MRIVLRRPDQGYLDAHLWIPKSLVSVEGVKSALTYTFQDPRLENKVRTLTLWRETPHHLVVPRYFWRLEGLPFPIVDCRPQDLVSSSIASKVLLDHTWKVEDGIDVLQPTGKSVQQQSMHALLSGHSGILQLACGAGKTVIALDFVAKYGGPAIVVVDNTQLLEQWTKEIASLLVVPTGVGRVQAGVFDWKKDIVLATYHTLGKLASTVGEDFRRHFRIAIFEEGHHISAPTFAPVAELFYGYRLLLSATPERVDGLHVIYDMHVGPVLHKNLTQDLTARVAFDWTGLTPDETRPGCRIRDKRGELHLSMLAVYYGQWAEHLHHVLARVGTAVQEGRKVLVLCNSVDEAVNLCAMWNGVTALYTDIPVPTPQDVGEVLTPLDLPKKKKHAKQKALAAVNTKLASSTLAVVDRGALLAEQAELEQCLLQCEIQAKITQEHNRRQREYLKNLQVQLTTGGLMIYDIKPSVRYKYIAEKQVVFAITKYGKEGLDSRALDTVITTMPFSNKWSLQQIKGRTERAKSGKKAPLLLIIEHNIGPVIGMCQKTRSHLRSWPIESGGPFTYELHGHPGVRSCKTSLFG